MGNDLYRDRPSFERALARSFTAAGVPLTASLKAVILVALAERDETAEPVTGKSGAPEPDPDLRDTENVPLSEEVAAYVAREVLPHVPDAWINEGIRDERDGAVGKVGYEIPFTRHFYVYQPLRPLEEIDREIKVLEGEILALSQAVTKGIDSAAPMADSGVGWMGEVPAHWQVRRLKQVARLESGHTPSRSAPEYWVDCTIPWVSLADVAKLRGGTVDVIEDTKEMISELGMANSAARLLPAGTVILSRTASVGFSAILGRPMATTQDFVNWICGPALLPRYLLQCFRAMQPEFKRLTMGSTHQTIYMPDVERFVVPLPPLAEQEAIVDAVAQRTAKLDALTAKLRATIARLGEYRTALIAAAVTGQIDVREDSSGLVAKDVRCLPQHRTR